MSDDDFSDDDDSSWKVRRSAAKCLVAIISNYTDLLRSLYPKISPLLVARFKEREESVKLDVFNAFIELLHQVTCSHVGTLVVMVDQSYNMQRGPIINHACSLLVLVMCRWAQLQVGTELPRSMRSCKQTLQKFSRHRSDSCETNRSRQEQECF